MDFLFPIGVLPEDVPDIPGLSYVQGYVSEQEEAELVAAIDAEPWDTTWDRRRQPYGGPYGRGGEEVRDIPAWGRILAERMHRDGITDRRFDQMLVNEYLPGQGIAMHRDYQNFDETVVSLSLLSPCVMDFRHVEEDQRAVLLLEPRSLLVMKGDARYRWEHGIARRKNDRWKGSVIPRSRRVSVTYRHVKT
jgi:alkylated DNA repair dioxygenase AlkB